MGNAWLIGSSASPSFLGLAEKLASLMKEKGRSLDVILVSQALTVQEAGMIRSVGASTVSQIEAQTWDLNAETQVRQVLVHLYEKQSPDYVIFESSSFFASVAPAFAASVCCGITADCTELAWNADGELLLIRPAFGGRKLAYNISIGGASIATVRKGVYYHCKPTDAPKAEIIKIDLSEPVRQWTLRERFLSEAEIADLSGASVILSGGLGMGSRDSFRKLYTLAAHTGATVGASRAAVAAGFSEYDRQIGQTGISVRPDLYFAFGISGAVQHLSGITGAKKIIAVNTDPKAPIHQYSDLSILADCNEVLDRLIQKLSKK